MDYQLGWQNFDREIAQADAEINLAKAALFYAQAEYHHLDINEYLNILDAIAEHIRPQLPVELYPLKVIQQINYYLFEELNFQGNQKNYYNPHNSFLNEVIERRMGIPITLSVIYLEVAKRLNFPMVGIGMPGHFLIRPEFEDVGFFVDVFNRGEILFKQDCQDKLNQIYPEPVKLESHFLSPISNRQILARMLNNLKYIYLHQGNFNKALNVMGGILMLFPENPDELRDRGLLYYQLNRWQEAARDLQSYITILPNGEDVSMIKMILEKISKRNFF